MKRERAGGLKESGAVFTLERSKEEVQEKSQDQTLDMNLQSKPFELNQYNPYTTRNSVNAKPVF
jgi:hypothetical protein